MPALADVAKGRGVGLDAAAVETLVRRHEEHAAFEEREFLPRRAVTLQCGSE